MGGGKWLTENHPTNFHTFATRRVLLDGESPDDWREVTDAEKTAIEATDAKWDEPDSGFIVLWNAACTTKTGSEGKYNAKTGYFELNGLKDITYAEATAIYDAGRISTKDDMYARYLYSKIRTNLPPRNMWTAPAGSLTCGFSTMEVFCPPWAGMSCGSQAFAVCQNLHTILGSVTCGTKGAFLNCLELKNISLKATASIDLPQSSKLSLSSVKYLAEMSTSGVTITVHWDVYLKLRGNTAYAVVAAMSEEEQAKWVAVMETAVSRNVTFAPPS